MKIWNTYNAFKYNIKFTVKKINDLKDDEFSNGKMMIIKINPNIDIHIEIKWIKF